MSQFYDVLDAPDVDWEAGAVVTEREAWSYPGLSLKDVKWRRFGIVENAAGADSDVSTN